MSWSFNKGPAIEWPFDADGDAVPPAFLTHVHGSLLDFEIALNLLDAYGIPHIEEYPKEGLFNKMIMGQSPGGIEIYVPSTMLEDAKDILNAEVEDIDETEFA